MSEKRSIRWIGEFVVIVLGVLVALGVDDWRQYRADRELEQHLLDRLATDLAADATDLALAQSMVARRLWVLDELTIEVDEEVASVGTGGVRFDPERIDSLANAGGRPLGAWDSIQAPLRAFVNMPEFDLSDDSYREMLATGALGTVSDLTLRSRILSYYRVAEDMSKNALRAAQYQDQLEVAWSWIDAAIGDRLSLSELVSRAAPESRVQLELRRARRYAQLQLFFFGITDRARVGLETALVESRGAAP